MKKGNQLLNIVLILLLVGSASCTYYQNPNEEIDLPQPELAYIGSQTCGACHQDIYETFTNSGHPYILQKIEDGDSPIFPFSGIEYVPPYFPNQWEDVSYSIGGFAWKAQYVDMNGYVYTGDDAQFNVQDSSVAAYHAGTAPGTQMFDCGKCHTTGYTSIADGGEPQDGMPGMSGDFFAAGVQCEACHGKGSFHAGSKSPSDITIDYSSEACGQCHSRNDDMVISASDGFIENYQQFDEMHAAGQKELSCVACHDPHVSVKYGQVGGIVKGCVECHPGMKNPTHRGADCVTCHLPYATKSAMSEDKYVGDLMTHIFKINPNEDGQMFNPDGTVANGSDGVTLGFVCYQCHKDADGVGGSADRKTLYQLSLKAKGYHN